jgi:hypothetical protein
VRPAVTPFIPPGPPFPPVPPPFPPRGADGDFVGAIITEVDGMGEYSAPGRAGAE